MRARGLRTMVLAGAVGLAGTAAKAQRWRIAMVDGRPALGAAEIVVGADGAIAGSTGCNRFSGTARMEDGALRIAAPLATTRMACPGDGLAAQEEAVLGVLQGRMMVAYDPFTGRMDLVGGQTSLGLVPVESAADAPVQAAPRVPGPPGPG